MDSPKKKPLAQVAAGMQKSCCPYNIIIGKDAECWLAKVHALVRINFISYNTIEI